ncbi:HD-GYP domain-containing protein [Clostridium sp.]|jgi:HD-GYP domain-containing protein (c-di-GMP phosphodiesterase class II)|uniref:HD-GYP domain-containing protein n=1 Tax=Clostridium sp. TaxID=1506 RepID=UPI0039F468AC
MRLEFLKNLKGEEILAKDIIGGNGEVLLRSGAKLSKNLISKLSKYGVFMIYVEDDRFSDITCVNDLTELKKVTLEMMPNLFNDLLEGDRDNCNKSVSMIEELVEDIISQNSININLYEVKAYDNYTYIHCVDTSIMSIYLGNCLKLNRSEIKELGLSAILHDIGKIKIPNEIINKRGVLTEKEFEIVKNHPTYGKEILEKRGIFSQKVIDGVFHHHERVDGSGYPNGLRGDKISDYAKIISVSDVFTAVSANRSYRNKFEPKEAYELILSGMGSKFDKKVIEKFKENFAIYPLGCCVRLSNGVEGYVIRQNKNLPDRPVIRIVYDSITKMPIQPYEIDLMNKLSLTIETVVE